MTKKQLIAAALKVAKKYPVFPTNDKKPVWSNAELGIKKGEGGYKIATQDPDEVKRLFSHARATEIAVPMGERSGLICIDVDTYKNPALTKWIQDNNLSGLKTRVHETRSQGRHFIFKWPGSGHRFPATLRQGVDLKGEGGFICFPPTQGYVVINDAAPKKFPLEIVEQALRDKGGATGNTKLTESFNSQPDDDVVAAILDASDLYASLRTLSYRLVGRGIERSLVYNTLTRIMDDSRASSSLHDRHEDWQDRYEKIGDLVDSAIKKQSIADFHEDELAGIMDGPPIMDTSAARPIGPQRETSPDDIEARVAELDQASSLPYLGDSSQTSSGSEYTVMTEAGLHERLIPPLEWLIPGMIPKASTISLGGTSNVGKTRIIAGLVAALSAGDTERMGLPGADGPRTSLWLANEERTDDIARRIKAAARQHNSYADTPIVVRGKDHGLLRLVALNEIGTPELDEQNVAAVVAEARRHSAELIIFDPYVTLSDAMDENSALSAAMLTKAFLLISNLTGATILHAHHTPKDRSKDEDWYRGSSGAWRGSGAIYSGLDCGFTLSHWMPKNREQRKKWKQNYLDERLSRWIVLDTGKIREGMPLEPIIFELVGQEMAEGEGMEIGVCRLADAHQAENSLLHSSADALGAEELARVLITTLGMGSFSMAEAHKAMNGHELWADVVKLTDKHTARFLDWYETPISVEDGTVQLVHAPDADTTGRWTFIIKEHDDG